MIKTPVLPKFFFFTSNNMPLFGRETEAQVILDALPDYHDGTFGYVVYRTVYGNDEEWGRFMDRLSQYANAALDRAPDGVNIKDSFQWDVRENREELEGASIAEVRKYVTNIPLFSILSSLTM